MERLGEPYAQKEWGSRVALDFFLGGAGSSLVAIYLTNLTAFGAGYRLGVYLSILSLTCVLGGLVLLASELGRPSNLWRSMANLSRSWMAHGSAFNLALLLALPPLAASFAGGVSLAVAYPFYIVMVLLSVPVSLYPGMLLHSVKDIKAWRSAFQPALTLTQAASSGVGLLLLVEVLSGSPLSTASAEALAASSLSLVFSVAFLGSLARSSHPGARATYSALTSAGDRLSFYPFVALGCALPIGCFLSLLLFPQSEWVQSAAGVGAVSLLVGSVVYRLGLLRSARHEPMTILSGQR